MPDHRKHIFAGRGAGAVKGTKKLQSEIVGMSDSAKRERRLEKQVAAKQKQIRQGRTARPASKRPPKQSVRQIQARVADLRDRANTAERGGHKRAAATYRQAAQVLLQRIRSK